MEGETFRKIWNNGLRLLVTPKPHQNVSTFKIFIRAGSRNDGDNYGITHFLEHVLFNRSQASKQLFYNVERRGGVLNANTTKEYLSIHCVIAKEYMIDILKQALDIIFHFSITESVVEGEKNIISHEILAHQNSNGAMWDLFLQYYWKLSPLRNPIRGYEESVKIINQDSLEQHYSNFISPERMVISCAGSVNLKGITSFLENFFSDFNRNTASEPCPNRIHECTDSTRICVQREMALSHLFIAIPTDGYALPKRLTYIALSKILGEGVYSRLYQLLREELKLVYSIESSEISYSDTGMLLIYAKCKAESEPLVEKLILQELNRLQIELILHEELDFIKGNYSGALNRISEASLSVCHYFGMEEIAAGSYVPFKESIESINKITPEDIRATASQAFVSPKIIIVGKKGGEYVDR